MRLNSKSLMNRAAWERAGYELPAFDREKAAERTAAAPEWLHLGAGNIFRAFPAALQQNLLDSGSADTGIVVAEGFDPELVEKAYRPFDNLSLLVTLKSDGSISKRVTGSVVESLAAVPGTPDWEKLAGIFRAPSLRMVSFTITEKGYSLPAGAAGTPDSPAALMEIAAAGAFLRYRAGALPLAFVSMDNYSHNGRRLKDAMCAVAERWNAAGLADAGLIDKITPRPDASIRALLEKDGYESADIIVTGKNTYTASFVNAEETEYLVVEDSFPNGRPPLEKAGVIFTDRKTVDRVERMKVCTCLNPLHTALAIFGCLLSYKSIHEEMRDPQLRALVERIGYDEGLPVVTHPGILDPRGFLDVVIQKRLPNPFMPDTPQRIACDTSQKIPIRFGETIKAYIASPELDVKSLVYIPLVMAGWCRYLMGIDDTGAPFEPSPDPLLERLGSHVRDLRLGDSGPFLERLTPILSDAGIFGVDLRAAGLADRVAGYFAELAAGPGAVRSTLKKHLG